MQPAALHFDTVISHRLHAMAWMFLEDVERVGKDPPEEYARLVMHLERFFAGAAIFLRRACESYFGNKKLDKVPNQQVMWFITLARHVGAHSTVDVMHGSTRALQARWSNHNDSGTIELTVAMTIDFDADPDCPRKNRDQAKRFLKKHGDNVFLALHEAPRFVADWVGAPLDQDFEDLRDATLGRVHVTTTVTDLNVFRRFVEVSLGEGEVVIGDHNSLRIARTNIQNR